MNRNMIIAAVLATSASVLSPLSFAEESSAFAAHFAALQERAQDNASGQVVASQTSTETQPAHAKATTEPQTQKDS